MGKRVSHSLLDPLITPLVLPLYRLLHIPRPFPPEGIVVAGHLVAILGAVGFAFSTEAWWGGLLAAAGVAGNHVADMVDGTHARQTGQCRNGGELLDHFMDPLSFSYWMIGMGTSCGSLEMALVGVIVIYATAVLTSIRAKLTGEFTLTHFGPTEMKTLLVLYAITLTVITLTTPTVNTESVAFYAFGTLVVVGVLQLLRSLVASVRLVNRDGAPPDTSDWELGRDKSA